MNHIRRALFARRTGQMLPALLLCALVGGCASGAPSWLSGWSQPSDQQAQGAAAKGAGAPLADFIGASGPGTQGGGSDPAYGAVQVTVGESYVSGLGEPCRKAVLSGGPRMAGLEQTAACQGSDGRWRMLPNLLAPTRVPAAQK